MVLDLIIGGIILLMGLFGYMRGAVRQIVQLTALVAAILLAGPAGRLLTPVVTDLWPNLAQPVAGVLALAAGGIGVFIVLWIVGTMFVWALRPEGHHPGLSRLNRLLGMVIGTAKGVVISLFILAELAVFTPEQVASYSEGIRRTLRTSATLYWVRQWNPIRYTDVIGHLTRLLDTPGTKGGRESDEQGELRRSREDLDKIKRYLEDVREQADQDVGGSRRPRQKQKRHVRRYH